MIIGIIRPLVKSAYQKINFLISQPKLMLYICCGYSKELSQLDGSFEHPKHMLKLTGKKIFIILRSKILFISKPVGYGMIYILYRLVNN